mmetsp:Transcript_10844/g.43905  ORF Transcript_10844/g.43905 Transcript_10844/m.43905 type:complete len:257 (-) Transcript_10844:160-930(-)
MRVFVEGLPAAQLLLGADRRAPAHQPHGHHRRHHAGHLDAARRRLLVVARLCRRDDASTALRPQRRRPARHHGAARDGRDLLRRAPHQNGPHAPPRGRPAPHRHRLRPARRDALRDPLALPAQGAQGRRLQSRHAGPRHAAGRHLDDDEQKGHAGGLAGVAKGRPVAEEDLPVRRFRGRRGRRRQKGGGPSRGRRILLLQRGRRARGLVRRGPSERRCSGGAGGVVGAFIGSLLGLAAVRRQITRALSTTWAACVQ